MRFTCIQYESPLNCANIHPSAYVCKVNRKLQKLHSNNNSSTSGSSSACEQQVSFVLCWLHGNDIVKLPNTWRHIHSLLSINKKSVRLHSSNANIRARHFQLRILWLHCDTTGTSMLCWVFEWKSIWLLALFILSPLLLSYAYSPSITSWNVPHFPISIVVPIYFDTIYMYKIFRTNFNPYRARGKKKSKHKSQSSRGINWAMLKSHKQDA